METQPTGIPFDYQSLPINFNPTPGTPLNDAVVRLGNMTWRDFDRLRGWQEVFPLPDFAPKPMLGLGRLNFYVPDKDSPEGQLSIRNQQLEWETQSRDLFDKCKKMIERNQWKVNYHVKNALEQQEAALGHPITLPILKADNLTELWLQANVKTVGDLYGYHVYDTPVFAFITSEVDRCRAKLGLGKLNTDPAKDTSAPAPKKESTIDRNHFNFTYFRQQVRGKIVEAIEQGQTPNEKHIIKTAMNETCTAKKVSIEKLRKDINPAERKDAFGKIYREETESKRHTTSRLKNNIGMP